MIIGGYAQGKTEYARNRFARSDEHILRLNEMAKELMSRGEDPAKELRRLAKEDPELIVITEEIGKGIVPAERAERLFREAIGRLQIEAASLADEVVQVTCGIGRRIK